MKNKKKKKKIRMKNKKKKKKIRMKNKKYYILLFLLVVRV
jgi:hypothetical protein